MVQQKILSLWLLTELLNCASTQTTWQHMSETWSTSQWKCFTNKNQENSGKFKLQWASHQRTSVSEALILWEMFLQNNLWPNNTPRLTGKHLTPAHLDRRSRLMQPTLACRYTNRDAQTGILWLAERHAGLQTHLEAVQNSTKLHNTKTDYREPFPRE